MALASWHIHFDSDPDIALHVCEGHCAIGMSLSCPDETETGDCAHVQHRPCTCQPQPPYDACSLPDIDQIDERWRPVEKPSPIDHSR